MKDNIEKLATYKYHADKWNKIIGCYFYCKDNQGEHNQGEHLDNLHSGYNFYALPHRRSNLSHIRFTSNRLPTYIVIPDKYREFYNITNTSFQVWELLFEMLKTSKIYGFSTMRDDDVLCGQLSHELQCLMKNQP